MKLWVFSDLHLEPKSSFSLPIPDADVCVVAGDLLTRGPENSIEWLARTLVPHMPVVFVAGNHEFYGSRTGGFDLALDRGLRLATQMPGMHFLENDVCYLGDARFVGCTLWTDFELEGANAKDVAWAMNNVAGLLADFGGAIRDPSGPTGLLTTQRVKTMHERSRRFLQKMLAKPFDGRTVVVTHHAPHRGSLHPRFAESSINAGFISDLESLILEEQPGLWVHGHVHDSFDYSVGQTRVVCNPKGYGDENLAFDPGFVVEV